MKFFAIFCQISCGDDFQNIFLLEPIIQTSTLNSNICELAIR